MIDIEDHRGVYLHDGELWRILSYCPEPSVTMVNINNADKRKNFGIHGLIMGEFKKVDGLLLDGAMMGKFVNEKKRENQEDRASHKQREI